MKELNEIIKQSVETFDEGCIGTYTRVQRARSHLISSQISLLEEMLDFVKIEQQRCYYESIQSDVDKVVARFAYERIITYLQDQITKCKEIMK